MNAEGPGGAGDVANPAAAADAEQHAAQEITGLWDRLAARRPRTLTSLAAAAAGMVSGWLIMLRRRHGKTGR